VRGNLRDDLVCDTEIRRALSLPDGGWDRKAETPLARKLVARRLAHAEAHGVVDDGPLPRNVTSLGRICGFTAVERSLVELAATIENEVAFRECFTARRSGRTPELYRLMSVALELPTAQIAHALRRQGALHESPIPLLEGLAQALEGHDAGVDGLIEFFVRRARRTQLTLDDFGHVSDGVELVARVLRGALRTRARGVNVLLYGDPGTGKTELARAVAASLRARVYEVNDEDKDGDRVGGWGRLGACALAQRMLKRTRRSLLVFDEAEDVFPHETHSMLGLRHRSTEEKSWTHRVLEETPIPTIWIANRVSQIDAATLRRFLVVVELRTPPRAVRARMIEQRLARAPVDAAWVARVASDDRFTPADADKVARVARLLGPGQPRQLEHALNMVLGSSLALAGPARAAAPPRGPTPYALGFVNASVDLERLARSLTSRARGTICLYGPPGTGKTAFVQHVAERLGKALHSVRGSDLLDMYVGQTEQNVARAFREASSQGAILLLDEVDGLLRDRSYASRSWEVTQVNELLVQMESFGGLLFCATNLVDGLDAASLRRFGLKVRFDPLRADQAIELFSAVGGTPDDDVRERLERMAELTAGDFAAGLRRLALLDQEVTTSTLLHALAEEWTMKRRAGRAVVGFRSPAPCPDGRTSDTPLGWPR
jgi:SpoVK/Ycf46/Vps4 family AAA+-type ATPase